MTAAELAAETATWTPFPPGSAGTAGDRYRADDPPIPRPRSGDEDSSDGRTAE